jgi:ParB family chromosome partitioning protein
VTIKKRGLGRGLDALLGAVPGLTGTALADTPARGATANASASADGELRRLPIEIIQRGRYQPRVTFAEESLEELADSIRAQGLMQPVVVRPRLQGGYELIAGERRWRAAQRAGLSEIPALVREVTDQSALAMALIENIQRENLNPLEEAGALERLIDEFGLTHEQAAQAVGRSRAAVSNLVRLLDLGEEVKQMVAERKLEMGHARALLALTAQAQRDCARRVVAQGLSVRETEQLVKRWHKGNSHARPARSQDPDVRRLQDELSTRIGALVRIEHSARGSGELVIRYSNLEQLDGILERIR